MGDREVETIRKANLTCNVFLCSPNSAHSITAELNFSPVNIEKIMTSVLESVSKRCFAESAKD